MSKLNMFARLTKVDEAKRQVTGILANEAVDHAGEIFDYESSVPFFRAWSETVQKASNGASVGNLRAQHGQIVAGKLSELIMDDVEKAIIVTADVVDDNEWRKVLAGCYTGFSVGGKYGAKWDDAALGKKRYTGIPSEASLVDLPCNPDANFTVCKADGSTELRKYVSTTDATIVAEAAAAEAANAVVPASATDFLRKQLSDLPEDTSPELRKYVTSLLDAAEEPLKKEQDKNKARLRAFGEALAKKADTPVCAQLLKAASSVVKEDSEVLAKGLWEATRICDLLCSLGYVTDSVSTEALFEGDGSGVPSQLVGVMRQLGSALIALVQEEVAEMMDNYKGDAMATTIPDGDLKKEGGVDAAPPAGDNNEALMKSFSNVLEKALAPVAGLAKSVETLSAQVKEQGTQLDALRKNTPAAGGPRLVDVTKEGELKKAIEPGKDEVTPIMGQDGKRDDVTTMIKQAHQGGGQPLLK